jgi:magnesium chelatase family protein
MHLLAHCGGEISAPPVWPLLDRIDIHVEVPRVQYDKLTGNGQSEPSSAVRARVQAARERQRARFAGTAMVSNADMGPSEVRTFCVTDATAQSLLKSAMQQLHLSARAFHRTLKLARSIADLAGAETITAVHAAEALQYRARKQV